MSERKKIPQRRCPCGIYHVQATAKPTLTGATDADAAASTGVAQSQPSQDARSSARRTSRLNRDRRDGNRLKLLQHGQATQVNLRSRDSRGTRRRACTCGRRGNQRQSERSDGDGRLRHGNGCGSLILQRKQRRKLLKLLGGAGGRRGRGRIRLHIALLSEAFVAAADDDEEQSKHKQKTSEQELERTLHGELLSGCEKNWK